jgi:RNA polymerase sigma factor (sigma-70 family)
VNATIENLSAHRPPLFCGPTLWHSVRSMTSLAKANSSATRAAPTADGGLADELLMEAYQKGDQNAFRTLFARYSPLIQRALTSSVGPEVARDLAQQTFLQLHRARNDFQSGRPLRPWVLTIAYNLKRDHLRFKKRRVETEIDPERHGVAATQTQAMEQEGEIARVRQAVSRLPDSLKDVVELHWFAEMPFGEVARVLGISQSAAKVRAHRAYKRLRELLDEPATAKSGAA